MAIMHCQFDFHTVQLKHAKMYPKIIKIYDKPCIIINSLIDKLKQVTENQQHNKQILIKIKNDTNI